MREDLLHPRYAERFHCVGSACEECCCQHWRVFVDKGTYQRYRATPGLQEVLAEHLVVNGSTNDPLKYATIKLQGDGHCPFLTGENLCKIQRNYGAEFLCNTCARYPRIDARIDGESVTALQLSCPEAARRVLLGPRLLPPIHGNRYGELRLAVSHRPAHASIGAITRRLRIFALSLIDDSSYPLWQRLFLLGIVCRRVHELMAARHFADTPQLVAQYAQMIEDGSLRSHLDGIFARPELQASIVLQLIKVRYQIEEPSESFAAIVADFLVGVGRAGVEANTAAANERYQQAHRAFESSFCQSHPEFFTNYLVNYMFRTSFPFANTVDQVQTRIDPLTSCLNMVLHYRLLHSLLAGVAAHDAGRFSEADALRVVRIFSRSIEHNIRFFDACHRYLQAAELRQADGLAVLLRN